MQLLGRAKRALVRLWISTHLQPLGHYAAERLPLLHAYGERFTLTRLALVLALTPWPSLTTIVALDLLPLAAPSVGTSRSTVFWLRTAVFGAILAVSCFVIFLRAVPMVAISCGKVAVASVVVGAGTALSGYALSLAIGFPLPFSLVLQTPAWAVLMGVFLASSAHSTLQTVPSARTYFAEWHAAAGLQSSTVFLYSFFNYAFLNASAAGQVLVSIVMQIAKIVIKAVVDRNIHANADIKAEAAILNVEVAHALFVTFSMQSSTSVATLVLLTLLDFVHSLGTYHRIRRGVQSLQVLTAKLDRLEHPSGHAMPSSGVPRQRVIGVVARATKIIENRGLDYWAGKQWRKPQVDKSSPSCFRRLWSKSRQVAQVPAPTKSPTAAILHQAIAETKHAVQPKITEVLRLKDLQDTYVEKVLELLHVAEYAVLSEFVEFVIPMIYAMYISILMTLPNRKYYQRIAVFDSRQLLMMLFRTSVYSFLELISLFRLDWMLRRQLRFSPIVQLSFRLETQWRAVQAALVMYVVYIIESMLEHHGTDYSFKFTWLHTDKEVDT